MNSEIAINNLQQLPDVSKKILEKFPSYRIFTFYAEMGCGKTTLIKAIVKQLGYDGASASPTYPIVLEYPAKNLKIFHFDLYRIQSVDELNDLGFEEYLEQNAYIFIEWPEIAEKIINHYEHLRIIMKNEGEKRVLSFEHFKP
ncbi:MAG: tRNA (adenosine(37)-N6)-threonylcarbamoyltransferase complex ATPase subunit type 1 TsaE [Bacteroidia bacterium]